MTRRLQGHVAVALGAMLAACAGPPKDLGLKDGRLAACPSSPNCVWSQTPEDDTHRIAPLSFADEPGNAWARLGEVLSKRGDTRVIAMGPAYARVEFRTLLGFVDDGEFVLDREGRAIHVRSAARLGYYDFGKNRRRMEEVRRAFSGSGP